MKTQILPATPENIAIGAQLLRDGGLVAFPTETVYGLGANALNVQAVERIFKAKGRPTADPLIVHIASLNELDGLVSQMDDLALSLMERFWPGPLTLVLPKTRNVPDLVTSGLMSVVSLSTILFPSIRIIAISIMRLRAALIPVVSKSTMARLLSNMLIGSALESRAVFRCPLEECR